MKKVILQIKENKEWQLFILLFFIIITSFLLLKPHIAGDSLDYLNSINFLETGVSDENFIPNRLLTTFGGLESVIFLSKIFRSIVFSWIFLNTILYFLLNFLFYKIIISIHKDEKIALLSTLFLASNYALISFGLNFLMDIGGWFFYVLSLYFSLKYLEENKDKFILLASLSVGVGLLFKEYAFLGVVPIAVILIYKNFEYGKRFFSFKKILSKSIFPALLATVPLCILYVFIYFRFGYTYADWLNTNTERYSDFNKLSEYIKSFGSLLNILGLIFIFGFYFLIKEWKNIEENRKLFIVGFILSILPLFAWPGITQRVLFVSVPVIVLVSSFLFKKYIKFYYFFFCIFLLYFLVNLYMDSFILNFVNLPF